MQSGKGCPGLSQWLGHFSCSFLCPNSWVVSGKGHVGASTRSLIHTDGETMLGTKRDWLCNAVALVIVLGLGLVLTKSQYKQPDRLTVAEWTERTLNEIFHK
jgi:hypothetical protein